MGSVSILPSDDSINFWSPFQFNFNQDPMQLEYVYDREWDFTGTCGIYCNNEGELLAYSNGMFIVDSTHQWMQGGEQIAYNKFWKNKTSKINNDKTWYLGMPFEQGNIFVPQGDNYEKVLNFTVKYNFKESTVDTLLYAIIDFNRNNNKGEVISKDVVLLSAKIKDNGLTATRHANGRDWWLLVESNDNASYYIFLIDSSGVTLHSTFSGIRKMKDQAYEGTNHFSLDGCKYVSIRGLYWDLTSQITILDFDRATGLLSNPRYSSIPVYEAGLGSSAIFSNDGRYLYANNDYEVYRWDTEDVDFPFNRELLAKYDGFISYDSGDLTDSIKTLFGYWQYGPDGKLYNVSCFGRAQHMHRMESPDEDNPQFEQHIIKTPNNPWTIPHFPNFRLGPLDGSPADTLGLDNHPIAKFRYEQDTTNHLNVRFTDLSYFRPETWHWDFDDGTTFEGKKPYWHEFPKNSTYNVCLTVSNENSEHTMCRQVTIGSTSTLNLPPSTLNYVSVFPNPTEGEVLLTLSDYIPEEGMVYVYDMMGRLVYKQRVYYGWNSIDISSLPTGQYLYEVKDKNHKIFHGSIIKI